MSVLYMMLLTDKKGPEANMEEHGEDEESIYVSNQSKLVACFHKCH